MPPTLGKQVRLFQPPPGICLALIVGCQGGLAWVMAAMGVVYAPLPMFVAAIMAGLLCKGRPKQAAWFGMLAGLVGGIPAEWAYYWVRILHSTEWALFSGWERVGLLAAEGIMYAAFLGFFAAFASWGVNKEAQPIGPDSREEEGTTPELPLHGDIPLFRPEDPPTQSNQKPPQPR